MKKLISSIMIVVMAINAVAIMPRLVSNRAKCEKFGISQRYCTVRRK